MPNYFPNYVQDQPLTNAPLESKPIRINFTALAVNNFTNKTTLPKDPRDGMTRMRYDTETELAHFEVFLFGQWLSVVSDIQENKINAIRKDFPISVAASTWTIDHFIGRMPLVQCLDSVNRVIVPADIQHASVNRVVIEHGSAITGKVIVIG